MTPDKMITPPCHTFLNDNTYLDACAAQLVLLRFHVLLQIELTVLEAQIQFVVRRDIKYVFQPVLGAKNTLQLRQTSVGIFELL